MVAGTLVLAGCGTPFGPCYSEAVDVGLAGTLDGAALAAAGQVAPGSNATYQALRAVLIDGSGMAGQQMVWTVEGVGGDGYLAVQLPANLAAGQTFPVSQVFVGGGWGLGSGAGVPAVSARFGAHQATTVTGTIAVLGVAPLRLRVDLTLGHAPSVTRRLTATATFSFRRESTPCT